MYMKHFSPQWKLLAGPQDTADRYTQGNCPGRQRWNSLTLAPATFFLAPLRTAISTEVDVIAASCSPSFNNLGNGS